VGADTSFAARNAALNAAARRVLDEGAPIFVRF
jgi:hypothetical protein